MLRFLRELCRSLLEQENFFFQEETRRRSREAKKRRRAVVKNQASAGIGAKKSGRSCKETRRRREKAPSNSRKIEADFTLSSRICLAQGWWWLAVLCRRPFCI